MKNPSRAKRRSASVVLAFFSKRRDLALMGGSLKKS